LAHRDWIDLLEAFGPLTAVVVALIVGVTQLWLQKKQLSQELFDKRYVVYRAIQEFILRVVAAKGKLNRESVDAFRLSTAHSEFLFRRDVMDFIEEVLGRSADLLILEMNTDDPEVAESYKALMAWMETAVDVQNKVFRPYLHL